jgi:pSer/pThr/pTyr-binding forkhead associated (FHA) protein
MHLILEVLDNGESFKFDANQVNEIILGRKDPDTGDMPTIDLTTSQGLSKGVSRRHATIVRRDGALHIVDNNSANGTFLNGQRLVSGQPRILRDGDDVRLGHLILRVTFRASQN